MCVDKGALCLKVPCFMEESSGVGCTVEMYGKCSVVGKSGWKSMVEVVKRESG